MAHTLVEFPHNQLTTSIGRFGPVTSKAVECQTGYSATGVPIVRLCPIDAKGKFSRSIFMELPCDPEFWQELTTLVQRHHNAAVTKTG